MDINTALAILTNLLALIGAMSAFLGALRPFLNWIPPGRTRAVFEALDLLLHRLAVNTEPLINRVAATRSEKLFATEQLADEVTPLERKARDRLKK